MTRQQWNDPTFWGSVLCFWYICSTVEGFCGTESRGWKFLYKSPKVLAWRQKSGIILVNWSYQKISLTKNKLLNSFSWKFTLKVWFKYFLTRWQSLFPKPVNSKPALIRSKVFFNNGALLARGSKGNSQLPLEPLANSDIPLVVIVGLLLIKNITKMPVMVQNFR